ncbi:hypothetical protein [Eilatimonas milleporae]|uniref:DUF3108 domain-containing protein n=1 Tax=Eilatimonas milleporae TaxID=911205 RepID=A0A3M0CKN6_9PROT|nr:hypothetical protein [Eilatimonas milleporae]RMB07629.1 hypothetical protein BXY39_1715 [Eilatimonas milleporae]
MTKLTRLFAVFLTLSVPFQIAAAQSDSRSNTSIVRQSRGTLEYRKLSDGALVGSEEWTLTVHPDGSRTLAARNRYDAYDVQRHVTHRVAKDFRPLETLAVYWARGEWRGSGLFMTRGNQFEAVVTTPDGVLRQEMPVPENFSLVPHPLQSNAWHGWYYDKAKGGPQPVRWIDIIVARPEATFMLGKLSKTTLEFIGEEEMTTPAGTFTVDHFRVGGVDYYVTGEDSIMVRFVWELLDTEFVLTSYTRDR